jgi:hypothetical protein
MEAYLKQSRILSLQKIVILRLDEQLGKEKGLKDQYKHPQCKIS